MLPDRLSLLHMLDPVRFARERLAFHPDPVQAGLLTSSHPRLILNCTRQWGKSTTTAALATHHLVFGPPGALAVIVSPSERQSVELILKIQAFASRAGVRSRARRPTTLHFPNGARAVGLPAREDTIRGFSAPSLVIIDEAAQVPDPVYLAVRPMLAAGNGRLILLSTPRGRRGFFFEAWSAENSPFHRVSIPATVCPRISPSFLEEERLAHGDLWFRQEYLCEFVDLDGATFPYDLVMAALHQDIDPL